jgi:hypothetical protein
MIRTRMTVVRQVGQDGHHPVKNAARCISWWVGLTKKPSERLSPQAIQLLMGPGPHDRTTTLADEPPLADQAADGSSSGVPAAATSVLEV